MEFVERAKALTPFCTFGREILISTREKSVEKVSPSSSSTVHSTVLRYCTKIFFIIFLVYLTLQMYDNMQELYFIKCLLVIHARNDASKIIF